MGEKDGLTVVDGAFEYNHYFGHSYQWGIREGQEYIFFCKKVVGKLVPILDWKMTYLQKVAKTDYWFGLYGIAFRSTDHLNNHFDTFKDIELLHQ